MQYRFFLPLLCWLLSMSQPIASQTPYLMKGIPLGFPGGDGTFALFSGFEAEGAWCGWWTPEAGTREAYSLPVSYSAADAILNAEILNENLCIHIFRQDRWSLISECFQFNTETKQFNWINTNVADATIPFFQDWRMATDLLNKIKVLDKWSASRPDSLILSLVPDLMRNILLELQKNQPAADTLLPAFFYSKTGQEILIWRKQEQAAQFFSKFPGSSVEEWLQLLAHWQKFLELKYNSDRNTPIDEWLMVSLVLHRNQPDELKWLRAVAEGYTAKRMEPEAKRYWTELASLYKRKKMPVPNEVQSKLK
jgi:hypothetical protein